MRQGPRRRRRQWLGQPPTTGPSLSWARFQLAPHISTVSLLAAGCPSALQELNLRATTGHNLGPRPRGARAAGTTIASGAQIKTPPQRLHRTPTAQRLHINMRATLVPLLLLLLASAQGRRLRAESSVPLTILHVNDVHARYQPVCK